MPWDFSMYGRQIQQDQFDKALQQKQTLAKSGQGGGATMAATQRLMQENPNLSFADAYSIAKSGLGQGIGMQDGSVNPLGGALDSAAAMAGAKQTGQNMSDLQYRPQIAGREAMAKNNAEQQMGFDKKSLQADDTQTVIDETRNLLTQDNASGSVPGAVWAAGKSMFGQSDPTTQANAQLQVLGGRLVASMPRMEGPQSDKDVLLYREMAGKIADPTVPAGDKLSAMQALEQINAKYAGQASFNPRNQNPNMPPNLPPVFDGLAMPPAMPAPNAPPVQGAKPRLRYNPATGDFE